MRTGPSLPAPARVADATVAAALALAAALAVTGPIRTVIADTAITVGWAQAAFLAAAIAAIRHAALPRPSMLDSVAGWRRALAARPDLRAALAAFWSTRVPVLAIGFVAVTTFGPAGGEPPPSPRSALAGLAARWDAQWYAGIALRGYSWQHRFDRQQNLAFFPAFPLAMKAAGYPAGAFRQGLPEERRLARLTWCGVAIALAAFLFACRRFSALARDVLGEARAPAAVLFLAAYPFALFYSAAYTESLFLFAALGAWSAFRRDRLWASAAWGLLAGLTRPNGCFLSIPLGLLALGWRDAGRAAAPPGALPPSRRLARLAAAAAPGVGMLIYTAYLYQLTGVWFAWSRMQGAWGRTFGADSLSAPDTLLGSGGLAAAVAAHPYAAINALGLIAVLVVLRPLWRLSPAWCLFVAANVAAPLLAGGLLSMGRITAPLFPVFLALAAMTPPYFVTAVVAGMAALQGLFAALFYTWRDVY
jgi:Mannosyltransferase (PIG-V)